MRPTQAIKQPGWAIRISQVIVPQGKSSANQSTPRRRRRADYGGGLRGQPGLRKIADTDAIAFVRDLFRSPPSASCTTSSNFLKYGFLHSGLLQDCSNSPDAADHPYVYNHMPAGPDITLAVLLDWTQHNYTLTRILLACVYAAGLFVFVRFGQIILDPLKIPGAGFVLLFVWPWIAIQGMDRLIYNLFPVLAFTPLVVLNGYYRRPRRTALLLVLGLAFVSSLYLEYALLTGLFFCWILRVRPATAASDARLGASRAGSGAAAR